MKPMRILVLGGTRFLGRAIVDAALGRGDTVTLFNRGKSNPGLFPGLETVTGDRTADLSALDGRAWDAVFDVACYDPAVARLSAEAFEGRAGRYVFVSTVSVYADQNTTAAQLEDAPVAQLRDGMEFPENYGPNKALCERVVQETYGDRALIGRPGLITGPHDPTDRVPYWPRRIARGGLVLAPGDPAALVQFIDVRDLAGWLADACHAGRGGVYNLTGTPLPFGTMLDLCKTATYSDAELSWIPDGRLIDAGVDPGMGIPLWIGEPGYDAFNDVDSSRAVAAGLACRPVTETLRDTLAWDLARGGPAPSDEGLSAAEEERLLRELAASLPRRLSQRSLPASAAPLTGRCGAGVPPPARSAPRTRRASAVMTSMTSVHLTAAPTAARSRAARDSTGSPPRAGRRSASALPSAPVRSRPARQDPGGRRRYQGGTALSCTVRGRWPTRAEKPGQTGTGTMKTHGP